MRQNSLEYCGQPKLHSELQGNLGYRVRSCLTNKAKCILTNMFEALGSMPNTMENTK